AGASVEIVFTSGERRVGKVFEADLELIAGETLVEVLHREADRLVVVFDDAAKVDGAERGIPGFPEGQPRDFVQEVPGQRASPIEDGREPRGVVSDEDVAVEEIAMENVTNFGARPEQRAQGSFSGNENVVDVGCLL